jgi:hypothetical protein
MNTVADAALHTLDPFVLPHFDRLEARQRQAARVTPAPQQNPMKDSEIVRVNAPHLPPLGLVDHKRAVGQVSLQGEIKQAPPMIKQHSTTATQTGDLQLQHPHLHPHPLTLRQPRHPHSRTRCDSCTVYKPGPVYHCRTCNLNACAQCYTTTKAKESPTGQ